MSEVIEVLKKSRVEGFIVKLPEGQLDRNTYLDVSKKLNLIGGKWKGGKISGFVFNEDPTQLLFQICNGENRNLKKEFQFFGTPDKLADDLVKLSGILPHHSVLEPSAGQGAIVKAINRVLPTSRVHCCELMPLNKTFLDKLDSVIFIQEDFLTLKELEFDRIIANPPFSKNQDIDHIYLMYSILKEGGRLVSIASRHWQFAKNKKEVAFKNWLKEIGAEIIDVERGEFKDSGTMIASCIIVINK